ncbi:MAG: hypothetical protein BIFFINMI_01719 [Phycisphaerae bacterium]|nr:hypothetical protein [Phycisphaerae bacterium]
MSNPDLKSRPVATGNTGLLFTLDVSGLITGPFFNPVYLGMAAAAAAAERNILGLFAATGRPDHVEQAALSPAALAAIDSFVCLELFDESVIARLASQRPLVVVDAEMKLSNVSSVSFDHAGSLKMAFDYLLGLGHRRIGFVGHASGTDPAVAARRRSFEQELARLDEPHKDRLLFLTDRRTHAGDQVKQWLGQPPQWRPTALIVIDNTFWGFLFALISAGLKVPADLSVVNVGTVQTWADYATHRMRQRRSPGVRPAVLEPIPHYFNNEPAALASLRPTTVSLSAIDMGRWAIEELCRRLAGASPEPSHQVFGPEMVIGNTTGPVHPSA